MALTHEEKMTNTLIDTMVATARALKATLPVCKDNPQKSHEIATYNRTIVAEVNALQRLYKLPEYKAANE